MASGRRDGKNGRDIFETSGHSLDGKNVLYKAYNPKTEFNEKKAWIIIAFLRINTDYSRGFTIGFCEFWNFEGILYETCPTSTLYGISLWFSPVFGLYLLIQKCCYLVMNLGFQTLFALLFTIGIEYIFDILRPLNKTKFFDRFDFQR